MEKYDINLLKEWAPLPEVFENIPSRFKKGILFENLNITSIDVIPDYIAFGSNSGVVFWYHRQTGVVQKLRCENISTITCVKIVSSVEFMVAAGSQNGSISIFQIRKENRVLGTKTTPMERYTINNIHKCPVTCVEWSKNGMKLFSGDENGIVILTKLDYEKHLSTSEEILNESYLVVQLNLCGSYLLVSTKFRSIICEYTNNDKWRIIQIGKIDRKILSNFGAIFRNKTSKPYEIICSRPNLRLWLANINGEVERTLIYKDVIKLNPINYIKLVNPCKLVAKTIQNFGLLYMYSQDYVLTYENNSLFVLNIDKLRIEAIANNLRNILDISVCEKEIFILEGPRSLIRISSYPEPTTRASSLYFKPLELPNELTIFGNILQKSPFFDIEDSKIVKAEECFETTALESLTLTENSPTTSKNNVIAEKNKRLEIYDKINQMQFDDKILYRNETNKKSKKIIETITNDIDLNGGVKRKSNKNLTTDNLTNGINLKKTENPELVPALESRNNTVISSKPSQIDVSFCTDEDIPFINCAESYYTVKLLKEAAEEIETDKMREKPQTNNKRTPISANILSKLKYPINCPDNINNINTTTTIPKITINPNTNKQNIKNITSIPKLIRPFSLVSTNNKDEIDKIYDHTKVPKIWNVYTQQCEDSDNNSDENEESDWEIINT